MCYYCGKKGHISKYCFKRKNKNKESANNTIVNEKSDEYAFLDSHAIINDDYKRVREYAMMTSDVSCNGSVFD